MQLVSTKMNLKAQTNLHSTFSTCCKLRCAWGRFGRRLVTGTVAIVTIGVASVPTQAIAIDEKAALAEASRYESIFSLYAENRDQGVGNYITADLALVSYSLIRQASISHMELNSIVPAFTDCINALAQALSDQQNTVSDAVSDSLSNQALAANIRFVQLVQALLVPGQEDSLDKQARVEYEHIVSASTITESPLWGKKLDYTQYKPRGRYAGDELLERYFRAFRYVSGQLFSIKPSSSTGIDQQESLLQTAQLIQLVKLISDNEELLAKRQKLDSMLSWQFGKAEDLRDGDVLQVLETFSDSSDVALLSEELFKRAVAESRQPRVIDGLVQINLLEQGTTMQDVMTGWRLLSSRFTVQAAVQQALLFDNTQNYVGPEELLPFGYGVVNGKAVKGYPTALEWLAVLGSPTAEQQLQDTHETAFEGYAEARDSAADLLRFLQGAELVHSEIAREGLSIIDFQRNLTKREYPDAIDIESINGFLVWQRFLEVLYSRQSYTASAKGLVLTSPIRESAGIEVAPELYRVLAHAAREQWWQSNVARWHLFAEAMDRLATISSQVSYGAQLTEADINYLNDVDKVLLNLTEGEDRPIVLDVHTNPNENLVVQQATGFARVVEVESTKKTQLRGARLSFHEFKQAMDERLTTDTWLERLHDTHDSTNTSF